MFSLAVEIKVIGSKRWWGQFPSMHSRSEGGTDQLPPTALCSWLQTFFSSNREPFRLLITNPLEYQVAGNFIKQNSPGSFNRGAQEAKTPLALWPNTRVQLHSSLPHSGSRLVLLSVDVCSWKGNSWKSWKMVLLREEPSDDPWEECCTGCEPFYSSDI